MQDDFRAELAALVPRLRRFAHALTGNREEGDDIVQSACLKALTRREQFAPGTRLDRWMLRIVQTTFLDDRRQRARRGGTAEPGAVEALSDGGGAAQAAEDRLALETVRRAMAALPEEQRTVLALVAVDGRSYREAAEIIGVPPGTVMSRLSRARAALAAMIGEGRS